MIGWVGSILLALCSIPQAFKSFVQGHSRGISSSFLFMWFLGEICMLPFIYYEQFSYQLLLNYGVNSISCVVIIFYKIFERERR